MINKIDLDSRRGHCKIPCLFEQSRENCRMVVLTGGPGAGKTAVLEAAKKILCQHVAILPEAAGIIFKGGFWRLESVTAVTAAQRAIFHIQRESESLVVSEHRWGLALCDRGSLDGLAYWPGSEESFWKVFQTDRESEYARYEAVLHLRTPKLGNGYNHQNPIRIETADEAFEIDERIHEVWRSHPRYVMIDSTESFVDKLSIALKSLQRVIPGL